MEHQVQKLENSQLEITMAFNQKEWSNALSKSLVKLTENLTIPGFRKGHVPPEIAKQRIDQNRYYNQAIDSLLSDAYRQVIETEKIVPWTRPKVEVSKMSDTELEVKIIITTAPEVTLGAYKNLDVIKKVAVVTNEAIEEEINNIRQKNAELVLKQEPASLGDTTIIDFEGFTNGKPFEGGKGENYTLELGSGSFIPGFEEQLVGLKAGESKEIEVTFPKDYAAPLAGKKATFKIKVHEVKEKKLPEIGQELFDELKIAEVTSAESFKDHVKTELMRKEEEKVKNEYFNDLLKKIATESQIDIGHDIIHDEADAMRERLEKEVTQNGLTFIDYLKMTNQTEESLHEKFHLEAEENIRQSLVLEKIAEVEQITVSPEIIDFEIAKIADQYKMEFDKVKEILTQDMARFTADVKARHIRDFLLQHNE